MTLISEALIVRMADRFQALGQPVRLRLVELLLSESSTPRELSDALGLTQQHVSKHLLSLHRAGIVSRRPEGNHVVYALVDESMIAVLRLTLESVKRQLQELSELASAATPDAACEDEESDPQSSRPI